MELKKQISIFLKNRPGALAEVTGTLAREGVNILAISVSDTVDHAVVRFIVDQNEKAKAVLEKQKFLVVENDVLAVPLSNQPGKLGDIATKLGKGNINIEYAYGTTIAANGDALVIFRVSDVRKAL
ncbi:MAG: ACT domain-containing protein, partial [Planctomycetota bacterium]